MSTNNSLLNYYAKEKARSDAASDIIGTYANSNNNKGSNGTVASSNIIDQRRYNKGFNSSGSSNSDWRNALDAMSMAALAKGADTETMLGFALGKYLSRFINGSDKNAANKSDSDLDKLYSGAAQGASQTTNSVTTPGGTTYSTTNTNSYGLPLSSQVESAYDKYINKLDHSQVPASAGDELAYVSGLLNLGNNDTPYDYYRRNSLTADLK